MSTRERWIIYPLLFMTLGIALRDKIILPAHLGNLGLQVQAGEIQARRIRCTQLQVDAVACERLQSIQSECRTLVVNAAGNHPVVIATSDPQLNCGRLEVFTGTGSPQVGLISTPTGGLVTTIGSGGRAGLIMGDTGKSMGVFAELPGGGPPLLLTRPFALQPKPKAGQTPTKPGDAAETPSAKKPAAPQAPASPPKEHK